MRPIFKKIRGYNRGYSFTKFPRIDNIEDTKSIAVKGNPDKNIREKLNFLLKPKQTHPQCVIKLFSTDPIIHNLSSWGEKLSDSIHSTLKYISDKYGATNIHVVIDKSDKNFAGKFFEDLPGINIYLAPNIYPIDDFRILSPLILKKSFINACENTVFLNTKSILNIAEIINTQIVSDHIIFYSDYKEELKAVFKVIPQIKIKDILDFLNIPEEEVLIIGNGFIRGSLITDCSTIITDDTESITVLRKKVDKSGFMPFMRPGAGLDSYTNSFLPSKRLKFEMNIQGGLRPCVNCGYCAKVCPVLIYPSMLINLIEHGLFEEVQKMGVFDCIDCGLCSYVCPSKIQVAKTIKSGKERIFSECSLISGNNKL